MTPDTPQHSPESPASGAVWLSVAQASAALNVSEKTVRKRIKTGEIAAQRVPQKRGGISYLVALETETEVEVEPEAKRNRNGSNNGFLKPLLPTEPEAKWKRDGTEMEPKRKRSGSETEVELLRATVERDASEISFLRGVIEQLQRDGAETRAALREALKAPRQLTSGTTPTAPEAATATAISPDEVSPVETQNGAELGEINDLIYKIFRE